MRSRLLALLVLPLTVGCSASPGPSAPSSAPFPGRSARMLVPGADFRLAEGGAARLPDGSGTVAFVRVESDSRCPQDAECVWEGDAVVRIEVGGAVYRLHTLDGAAVDVGAHRIRLLALTPRPRAEAAVPHADYRATFRLDPA